MSRTRPGPAIAVITAVVAVALSACSPGTNAGPSGPLSPTGQTAALSPTPASSSPTPAPSATGLQVGPGESGWTVYSDAADGFEFQTPAWMNDVTGQAAAQNPLVRAAVVSPFVQTTAIQVLVVPLDPGTTLDSFASTTSGRLAQLPGFGGISHRETTTLGGQSARRFDWSASSGGATLIEREYLVVRDGRGYVLSIDTTPSPRDADFAMFAKVAGRFGFAGL